MLAPLRKRQFFSLAEANAAIAEQLAMVNDGPFRGQPISRRALFEELERAALQPRGLRARSSRRTVLVAPNRLR